MESVLIKVLVGGAWEYWAEASTIADVLTEVAVAELHGLRVWVKWPRDASYLVAGD